MPKADSKDFWMDSLSCCSPYYRYYKRNALHPAQITHGIPSPCKTANHAYPFPTLIPSNPKFSHSNNTKSIQKPPYRCFQSTTWLDRKGDQGEVWEKPGFSKKKKYLSQRFGDRCVKREEELRLERKRACEKKEAKKKKKKKEDDRRGGGEDGSGVVPVASCWGLSFGETRW